MKKIFSVFMFMLCAISVNAQGTWVKDFIEGDELKGTESSEVFRYDAPGMGSFIFWGFNEFQFRIVSDEILNIESGYAKFIGNYCGESIIVGIYDLNNKLIDKFTMWLDAESNKGCRFIKTRNAGSMSNPIGQKSKVKKIFKALQANNVSYVRIICQRYNMTDFDIKITPINI